MATSEEVGAYAGRLRSENGGLAMCPPAVEYSRELQGRAADELAWLPEGSIIAEMLSDYAVMREQARACSLETS